MNICVHWCQGDLYVDTSVATGKKKNIFPGEWKNLKNLIKRDLKSHAQPSIFITCALFEATAFGQAFAYSVFPTSITPKSQLSENLNSLALAFAIVKHHLRLATTDF